VAGIGNKDREWWRYIGFDFISLNETWVNEKGWKIWKERLPRSHEWACDFAIKSKNKRRARGGFIIRKKKRMEDGKMYFERKKRRERRCSWVMLKVVLK